MTYIQRLHREEGCGSDSQLASVSLDAAQYLHLQLLVELHGPLRVGLKVTVGESLDELDPKIRGDRLNMPANLPNKHHLQVGTALEDVVDQSSQLLVVEIEHSVHTVGQSDVLGAVSDGTKWNLQFVKSTILLNLIVGTTMSETRTRSMLAFRLSALMLSARSMYPKDGR